MRDLSNLELANESFWLWPPIADAVQTFLRRRDHSSDYEKTWRLIHIWESIVTTLSNIAVARLQALHAKDEFLKAREMLYGLGWDKIDEQVRSIGQGALAGSNDSRIEILNGVRKSNLQDSAFLNELRKFLNATGSQENAQSENGAVSLNAELQEFARAWRRVCDIPRPLDRAETTKEFSVFECLQLMNMFRNRFAHVPFPFDPLQALVDSIEGLTQILFSLQPFPYCHVDPKCVGRSSVLTGSMADGRNQWRGVQLFTSRHAPLDSLHFCFPAIKPTEKWHAAPFVHVDVSKRPYVLTRLVSDETGTFEYTRFWAEGNAIITADYPEQLKHMPPPSESDYVTFKSPVPEPVAQTEQPAETNAIEKVIPQVVEPVQIRTAKTYHEANEAIHRQDYDAAIPALREEVKVRSEYHNAWLKLGYALREKAGRSENDNEAVRLLHESYQALKRATEHRDARVKATAFYDLSKVNWRLFQLTDKIASAKEAWRDANQAARHDTDVKYLTWIEYLERALPSEAIQESRLQVTT